MHSFAPSWRTVICIADAVHFRMDDLSTAFPFPEGMGEHPFESVENHIGRGGRNDAPLRRPFLSRVQLVVLNDTGL